MLLLRKLLLTSHLSAGSLPLIISNFSSQYCANHATTLWRKCHQNTIYLWGLLRCEDIMMLTEYRRWDFLDCIAAFVLDSPLMVERTPQCPRYHLHELLCLSWACKLSSLDGFHSLGRLSDLWRHTFRMVEETDAISHFLLWHWFILEVSDYPGSVQPSLLKPRQEEKMTYFSHKTEDM